MPKTGNNPLAFAERLGLKPEGNELDALLALTPASRRMGINAATYTGVVAICLWRLFLTRRSLVVVPTPSVGDGAGVVACARRVATHADEQIRHTLYFQGDWTVVYRDYGGSPNQLLLVPYGWLDRKPQPGDPPLTIAFWDYDRAPGKAIRDALALACRPCDLVVINHPHGVVLEP